MNYTPVVSPCQVTRLLIRFSRLDFTKLRMEKSTKPNWLQTEKRYGKKMERNETEQIIEPGAKNNKPEEEEEAGNTDLI